jgi:hypothetical protein
MLKGVPVRLAGAGVRVEMRYETLSNT